MTPLPLECLAEEIETLACLQKGDTSFLPPWMTLKKAIQETKSQITKLAKHITNQGNTWEKDW